MAVKLKADSKERRPEGTSTHSMHPQASGGSGPKPCWDSPHNQDPRLRERLRLHRRGVFRAVRLDKNLVADMT